MQPHSANSPVRKRLVFSWKVIIIGMASLMMFQGCSHETQMQVVPVSGKLFFEGKPAVGATVTLHHLDRSVATKIQPTGIVAANGTFKIGTYDYEDGAPPGSYKATFEWSNSDDGGSILPTPFSSPELSNFRVKVLTAPTILPPFEFQKPPEIPAVKPDFMP